MEGTTVRIETRLPPELAEELERMARANDRSVAMEVRRAVREHVTDEGGRLPDSP